MSKSAKRKPGRPSLGKRQSFTFRVRGHVRDLLVAAAQSSGVSVSEEIERRVELTFSSAGIVSEMFGGIENAQLLFAFAVAIQEVERNTGKPWWADALTNSRVGGSIREILHAHMPRGLEDKRLMEEFYSRFETPEKMAQRFGPFIDHFQIGGDGAAFAIAKTTLATRNAPAKAPDTSPAQKAKDK